MTVEQIPSDKLVKMTSIFHRAFNAAGCDPECHCCGNKIPVGENFKLSTVVKKPMVWGTQLEEGIEIMQGKINSYKDYNGDEQVHSQEVMLCHICTPLMYHEKVIEQFKGEITSRDKPRGGCFRINGVIVH